MANPVNRALNNKIDDSPNQFSYKKPNLLPLALFSFSVVIASMTYAWIVNTRPEDLEAALGVMALLGVTVILLFVFIQALKNRFTLTPFLHPPVLITIWLVVMYGLPTLASMFNADLLTFFIGKVKFTNYHVLLGWCLIFCGLLAIWAGYGLGIIKFSTSDSTKSASKPFPFTTTVTLIAFAFVSLVRLIRISVIGVAYGQDRTNWGTVGALFDQSIYYLQELRYLFIVIALVGALQHHWPKFIVVLMVLVEVLFAFTSGFSSSILWVVIVIISTMYLPIVNQRIRIRPILPFIIAGVILCITIVPISETLRIKVRDLDTRSVVDVLRTTGDAYRESWGQGLETGWKLFSQKIFGRQAAVGSAPGIIIMRTPDYIPYKGAQKFLEIPLYLVPRFLIPDKPVLSQGRWFSVEYFNMPYTTNSASAMTIFGETYIFAGWPGTILGSFVLGILLGVIFRKLTSGSLLTLIYVTIIPIFMDVEGEYTTLVVGLIQSLIVQSFAYWLLAQLSGITKDVLKLDVENQRV